MPYDPHEEFRELCALSTTGELTQWEWSRLNDHLVDCGACRELKREYEQVVATVIPSLADESGPGPDEEEGAGAWSIDQAEARLMKSLPGEQPRSISNPVSSSHPSQSIPVRRYAIAALILGGCTMTAYRVGVLRGPGSEAVRSPALSTVPVSPRLNPSVTTTSPEAGKRNLPDDQETYQLRNQVRSSQLEIAELNDKLDRAEKELTKREGDIDRSSEDQAELGRELADARASRDALESRLNATGSQSSQQTLELLDLKNRVNGLNTALAEKDREIARDHELLERDHDIRNLIGARNLYIAEIYDVSKTGDTEKPFGRVFYTKDKSLVFYGYDLDQQKGVRKDASFQAWGRRGTDRQQDVSLGLLYQDDANKNRWVLKFNDAKTIDQIDAVFITAEPEGGSTKPTGKPLLFTYLRLDPNHP